MKSISSSVLLVSILFLGAAPAAAAEEDQTAPAGVGLNLDLGWASAFVFRGINLFQEDRQLDPHMLLAPGVSWSVFDTGLSIAYWGAFGLNGGNRRALIDAGIGAEQDLIVTYELALPEDLGLAFGLAAYLFPFAKKAAAGARVPAFLEPSVTLGWSSVVDLSFSLSYFAGLERDPGIRGYTYLYLHPAVGRSFALADFVELRLAAGYGFKRWRGGNTGQSNIHDLHLDASASFALPLGFYLAPGLHLTWTDLNGQGLSDEYILWGGLNVGVDL